MRIATGSILAVLATIAATACGSASAPPGLRRALAGIRGDSLRAHMSFLADDRLEGRGTGTRGYDMAAAYMAAQFAAAGLEPGGTRGSWYQPVPFRRMERDRAGSGLMLLRGGRQEPLAHDADMIMGNDPAHERAATTAALAFAGFGITAPELGYDDYAHVDVRGKVAVILSGGPPTFPSEQRAYHSSTLIKTRTAVARGAIGIITVRTPVDEARAPWARSVNQSELPGMRWLDPRGVPNESYPELQVTATLSRQGHGRCSPIPRYRSSGCLRRPIRAGPRGSISRCTPAPGPTPVTAGSRARTCWGCCVARIRGCGTRSWSSRPISTTSASACR